MLLSYVQKRKSLNEIYISFSIEECMGPILCRFSDIFVATDLQDF